jgi:hypothetical protein
MEAIQSKSTSKAGQKNSVRTPEKNPPNPYGPKIAQTALQCIGLSTRDILGRNSIKTEYALAISVIFTKATHQRILLHEPPLHVLSTSILYNCLLGDKRFTQIPLGQASPGDIIIATHKSDKAGYAGILIDHSRTVSMTPPGAIQANSNQFKVIQSNSNRFKPPRD